MSFSIRLTAEERRIAERYAKLHRMSLAEAFRRALFEKIENEYDTFFAEEAYAEYSKDPTTYSLDEVKEMFDIED